MHINPDHFLQTSAGRLITDARNALAWEKCFDQLDEALAGATVGSRLYLLIGAQGAGKSTWARRKIADEPAAVVFDAILVRKCERTRILTAAANREVPAVAVWFRTSLAHCLERNSARAPDEVADERGLRNVFAALEPPELAEGFADIIEV